MRLGSRRAGILVPFVLPAWLAGTSGAVAQDARIVSANSTQQLTRDHPLIDVNAYHSHTCSELTADLQRQPLAKPIIISDDGGRLRNCTALTNCPIPPSGIWGLDASCTQVFANEIRAKGQHFEHLSVALSTHIESGLGLPQGWTDLSADDQQALKNLAPFATPLAPGGNLTVARDAQGRGRFYWNGQQITLMGFSVYGAMVSNQVDATKYLDALKLGPVPGAPTQTKGVNFTRIWLTDMWTALATAKPNPPYPGSGLTPFEEAAVASNTILGRYKPDNLSNQLFSRLRDFVQKAWDRGIVVQVTLFERNGVRNVAGSYGHWLGSPYNADNNTFSILTAPTANQHPPDFLSLHCLNSRVVARWHRELILRTLLELQGYGNVIFEIINEAEGGSATSTTWLNQLAPWHDAVASAMDETLTTAPRLVWDRFDTTATPSLHNRLTYQCTGAWKAANAVLSGTGTAVNSSSAAGARPRGTLPLDYSDLPSWTATIEARGNVPTSTANPDTWFAIGFFSDNGSSTTPENVFANGQLWMGMRQSGQWWVDANGTNLVLGQGTAAVDPNALKHIQLRYDPVFNRASAWVNGTQVLPPTSLGSFHPNIQRVGFDSYSSTSFPLGSVALDDFEVRIDDNSASGSVRLYWAQPQALAGFGPPGSLVLAGSAFGPPGATVTLRWRDATANGAWVTEPYTPLPDASGIWYHAIPDVNTSHLYAIQLGFTGGAVSPTCVYPGTGGIYFCP